MDHETFMNQLKYRQTIASKIHIIIQQSGINTYNSGEEIEKYVYQESKTKDEYLVYISTFIKHVRNLSVQKEQEMDEVSETGQGSSGMPDSIKVSQNLARQGTKNQMINLSASSGQSEDLLELIHATVFLYKRDAEFAKGDDSLLNRQIKMLRDATKRTEAGNNVEILPNVSEVPWKITHNFEQGSKLVGLAQQSIQGPSTSTKYLNPKETLTGLMSRKRNNESKDDVTDNKIMKCSNAEEKNVGLEERDEEFATFGKLIASSLQHISILYRSTAMHELYEIIQKYKKLSRPK